MCYSNQPVANISNNKKWNNRYVPTLEPKWNRTRAHSRPGPKLSTKAGMEWNRPIESYLAYFRLQFLLRPCSPWYIYLLSIFENMFNNVEFFNFAAYKSSFCDFRCSHSSGGKQLLIRRSRPRQCFFMQLLTFVLPTFLPMTCVFDACNIY